MTRLLRDSIDPSLIPTNTPLIGGYVDGRFGPDHALFGEPGWDASSWNLFPNSVHVRIAVFATTNDGNVGDVEFGDITPAQAPAWVQMRRAAGVQPSIYCSLSEWPSVRSAFQSAGVAEPPYWIAAYDGTTDIYAGSVARQYDNGTGIVGPSVGGAYDSSAVVDYWPGIDPVPVPPDLVGGNDVGAIVLEWNGQLHRFKTDASGTVQHAFSVAGKWQVDQPLTGLVSNAPLTFDVGYNGQLHIFGDRPDTKTGHSWFDSPTTPNAQWHTEVMPV